MFLTMGTHGADQMMVQRYLGARNQRDAGVALGLSGVVVLAQFALFLLIGVGLACFYDAYPPCPALARNDEVFSTFIVDHMSVGAVGLLLAAVFSAAMSTLSGSLNSSATTLISDLVLPLLKIAPVGPASALRRPSGDAALWARADRRGHRGGASWRRTTAWSISVLDRSRALPWDRSWGCSFWPSSRGESTQPAALVGLLEGWLWSVGSAHFDKHQRLLVHCHWVAGDVLIGLAASRFVRGRAK